MLSTAHLPQGLGVILYRSSDSDFGTPDTAMLSAFNYGLYGEFGDFFASFTTDGSSHVNTAATLLFNLMMITVQVIVSPRAQMWTAWERARLWADLTSCDRRAGDPTQPAHRGHVRLVR